MKNILFSLTFDYAAAVVVAAAAAVAAVVVCSLALFLFVCLSMCVPHFFANWF